ncbi:S49 family peptidase [Riemerella anatipestifer]|uniref:S49 family peptidase n=1 Tax=Riemerella anatipestifer TaxID=34085 RepID=UPI0007ECC667|nr:S49 family peptidase [Riemerella anatipestifer]AZZ58360.1 hypothetical protein AWB57_04530 [Riemerella anatipestifer]MCO7317771.1 S49 family peptidase [Riemerella anatipestifer]MCW0473397.1 S49 family peptidase [Riemerella anatipestifer]MCW0511422.1 S49 family peptidase [Riemerella anatipestifer]MCW0519897.1 S49 family peptidase [Riemerella anatipestifer]
MNILSEILRDVWLMETPTPNYYRPIVDNILSGKITDAEKPLVYTVLSKRESLASGDIIEKDKVAVISMIGPMTKYNTGCDYGAEYFASEIMKAQNNEEIKGIILFMDGPGGNANAITLFQALKGKITKPVISVVDTACSLHYWIASMLSDHIMLNNDFTAEVGSIGAMIVFEKPNNEIKIIRPKESKDKNQAIVEALEGNFSALEERLSVLAQRFQKEVKEARPKIKEEAIFGKTYTAQSAIDVGLADSFGGITEAYNLILAKSELTKINK